jgi:hypothetical protein
MQVESIDTQTPKLPQLPRRADLINPALSALDFANSIVIDDDMTYRSAAEELQTIKGKIAALNEKRVSFTRPLDDLKKQWMAFFDEPIIMFKRAEEIYKTRMLGWTQAQEALRRIEEAKLKAAAEIERQKKEAEAFRLMQEAQEAARKAQEAASAGDVSQAAQLHADAMLAEQDAEAAILEAQVTTMPALPEVAKVAGISTTYTYSAKVEDVKALLTAIVEGRESIGLISIEALEKAVSQRARAEKEAFKIAGCALIKTPTMRAGKL